MKMLSELEELGLQVGNLILLLRLFQEFSSVLNTRMDLFLKLSCGLSLHYMAKVHSEPTQTSKVEVFAKIVNDFQPLILDV